MYTCKHCVPKGGEGERWMGGSRENDCCLLLISIVPEL